METSLIIISMWSKQSTNKVALLFLYWLFLFPEKFKLFCGHQFSTSYGPMILEILFAKQNDLLLSPLNPMSPVYSLFEKSFNYIALGAITGAEPGIFYKGGPNFSQYVETVFQLITSTPRQFIVTVHHIS